MEKRIIDHGGGVFTVHEMSAAAAREWDRDPFQELEGIEEAFLDVATCQSCGHYDDARRKACSSCGGELG